jgi:hypothetical protein
MPKTNDICVPDFGGAQHEMARVAIRAQGVRWGASRSGGGEHDVLVGVDHVEVGMGGDLV